ncbi:MAG: intein-containing adenosylcobalamin-dependent ribonucleoside-diphosphate reductase [Deltaproteobacteria bacterium]|nr:intein-containing adenosylcobalamin-dependent ribonucleoside-diphosphate reductase [Deltaproteobacteria bacterium]
MSKTKGKTAKEPRQGLTIPRRHTQAGIDPLDQVEYAKRRSVITNPDGSVVFQMDDVEVPAGWSQLATDIIVSKYFRKRGVPGKGHETSARQVVHRVAHTIRVAGEGFGGYFATRADAEAFEAELAYYLLHQYGAFNSPVWFNCGLGHEYGIRGSGGNWCWNSATDEIECSTDAYQNPQCSACFIQKVEDDLMSIFDLAKNEARLFKYGSGTGTNFSHLRGRQERLSGGGTSSGLMSFLEVLDRGAGATKSGGTTRRAAKMVCLDMDHPEIVDFVNWKVNEEKKVRALIESGYSADFNGEAYRTVSGQNSNNSVRIPDAFMEAFLHDGEWITRFRTTDEVCETLSARQLMRQIASAAWACADPGVQFDTTINTWHTCKATGRINASNPCVTGDTLIATAEGLRPIADLVGSAVDIITADGEVAHVTEVFATGFKEVYELRTQSGYTVKLTGDHKVWTRNRGDVSAKELVEGDELVCVPGPFGATHLEQKMAEFIGLALGDGCKARDAQGLIHVTMGSGEAEILQEYVDYLNTVKANRKIAGVRFTDTGVRTATSAEAVVSIVDTYAVLDQGAARKRLHPTAFCLDRATTAAVLRGLFTTDGTVANYGEKSQYIALDSTSLPLLRQAQKLLLSFGIKSKLYENRRNGKSHSFLPDGQGGLQQYAVQEIHSLRISRSSRILFEEMIGFHPKSAKTAALRALNEAVGTYRDELVDLFDSLTPLGTQKVYDLTEPKTHHFVADGLLVHNCSEYMFLDDSACNLASLNLMKFYDAETGVFDIEGYRHAIRIFFVAQEILVDFSSYPTRAIAQNSHDYRPLGLGYANLGTLLMVHGIPYDSAAARAMCAAFTAILTGHAYRVSAEMAATRGAFPGYAANREPMLGVIGMHRDAAYQIDMESCPGDLVWAARADWDAALELGRQSGYRNAQATVIAPTGCLVGGSLIPTERGLVRLRSLGNPHGQQWQDLGISVGTDEGPRTASKFYINGAEPVVTIETSRGYRIQGTPTHRMKVVDPSGEWVWRRFAEVEEGDLVPLALDSLLGSPCPVALPQAPEAYWTSEHLQVPRTMNAALAELVGYFMGDGSLHAKGLRFCVAQGDTEVVERLAVLARRLFEIEPVINARQGYTEVAFQSVTLTLWWEACGFAKRLPHSDHSGKGYLPHISDAILHTNDRTIYAAFLRGLFEADGTVTNGAPTWSSVSLDFSRDVQSLLLALGYPTSRKMDECGWGKSPLAVLRVFNRSYNTRWADEIGFISARKNEVIQKGEHGQTAKKDYIPLMREMVDRLAPQNDDLRKTLLMALARHGMVSRRSAEELYHRTHDAQLGYLLRFFYDRVHCAELGEEELTYDLSVPENVTYIANGFVSHNTIGLLMDCDTTGIEPDYALVKFKKLAGGGYFKIINQSIPAALKRLGYTDAQVSDIVTYVKGSLTLAGAPHVNTESLRAKGFADADLATIERALPGVFDLAFAFNHGTLGEACLRRVGIDPAASRAKGFSLLAALGFTAEEIAAANRHICGMMTIEGAPGLKPDHLPIFDCANKCGHYGRRFIQPTAHITIMAAAQQFISGAISKTINVPYETTVEEIERLYIESWRLGLKACALYRDGSKMAQPLATTTDEAKAEKDKAVAEEAIIRPPVSDQPALQAANAPTVNLPIGAPLRRHRLPKKRRGFTQEARVGGNKVYLRTGEYEDGTLGEIFIDMHKEGAAYRSMMNCFAIAVSLGLQYGVPIEEFVNVFTFTRFEPSGVCDHPNIKMVTSVVDYLFRVLGMEYLGRTDFVQVKPEEREPKVAELDEEEIARQLDQQSGSVQLGMLTNGHANGQSGGQAKHASNNGHANGHQDAPAMPRPATPPPIVVRAGAHATAVGGGLQAAPTHGTAAVVSEHLAGLMGDAPFCDQCGHVTVRSGSCYKCVNCGNSMGCS